MVTLSEAEIDRLIEEDVPYFDLTTSLLGIGERKAKISYLFRHRAVVCGTEECKRIIERYGGKVFGFVKSGKVVNEGETILEAKGDADSIHKIWKVTQNLLEYASGIATRTKTLVDAAKSVNPDVEVVTTRKTFPFSKKLCVKGILSGGALPHRLGLSETVLIFEQHMNFVGGFRGLLQEIPKIKKRLPEKKITVEVKSVEEAFEVLKAGVDVVQLDKLSVDEVKKVVSLRDKRFPLSKVAAAGGINEENIRSYASTGVDIIVLTCAYFGKPADVKVRIEPC